MRSIRVGIATAIALAALLAGNARQLLAQVSVSISPGTGSFTNSSVAVGITWCSSVNPLNASSRVITFNGTNVTSQFGYVTKPTPCTFTALSGGTVTLHTGPNTLSASIRDNANNLGSSSVTYTLNDKLAATLAIAYADKFRDVGRCVADCFVASAQYSTPTYTTLDVERGVTLAYRSDRVRPQGIVRIDATDASTTPVNYYSLLLKRADGSFVTFVNGQQELYFVGGAGVTPLVAQFDASSFPDTAIAYTAVVRSRWNDATVIEATIPARVLIANSSASALGAGWEIAQLQHAKIQTDGALVLSGDGSASWFESLSAPPGDFTVFTFAGSGYSRTYKDGTKFYFSSTGQPDSIVDRFGNVTVVGRNGSRVTSITDPVGQVIALGYDGSNNLSSMTTMSGTNPRTSSATVN
ncbi:MAG TPA: RHS repeat domain-containing protein, partial [Gemmatimonadaceae bacterium]